MQIYIRQHSSGVFVRNPNLHVPKNFPPTPRTTLFITFLTISCLFRLFTQNHSVPTLVDCFPSALGTVYRSSSPWIRCPSTSYARHHYQFLHVQKLFAPTPCTTLFIDMTILLQELFDVTTEARDHSKPVPLSTRRATSIVLYTLYCSHKHVLTHIYMNYIHTSQSSISTCDHSLYQILHLNQTAHIYIYTYIHIFIYLHSYALYTPSHIFCILSYTINK